MEIKLETLLLVAIITFEDARAAITVKPSTTEALVGSSTFLNCSTSLAKEVHWYHYTAGIQPSSQNYIYYYGQLYAPYKDRFQLNKNQTLGSYDIVIPKVELSDAGVYACQDDEGSGETVSAELIVLETSPTCSSTMKPDGVVGVNSCNIEPEQLRLSCSVSYRGKSPPLLEWRNIEGNTSITKGLTTETANNRITLHLTMASEPSIDGSSYVCQTPKANYYCISNVIKIIYAISSNAVQQTNLGDTVECKANASQPCSYRWKWFKGDDVLTLSSSQTLIPKQPGNFRCEADCFIRNQLCIVTAMFASVDDGNATYTTGDLTDSSLAAGHVVLIVCLVLIIIAVIASVVYFIYKRRRSGKRQSYPEVQQVYMPTPIVNDDVQFKEKESLLKSNQVIDDAINANEFSKLSALLTYVDKGTSGEVYGPCQFKNKSSAFQRILYSVSKLSTGDENLQKEIEAKGNLWTELDHENIIKFYCVRFEKPALYIFMEFAEGGTVRNALDLCRENLPNDVIINWALQIARGMEYLHSKDIVHSHLKSAQVLIMESFDPPDVSNKTLKISSCRISTQGIQSAPGSFKGMFAWESPESIQLQTFSKGRDIWSYGVTVWEILARKIPYTGEKNAAIINNVLNGNKALAIPTSCPAVLHDLVKNCWAIEPEHRPSFSDIVSTLNDINPILVSINDGRLIPEGLSRMPYIDKGMSGEIFGPFLFRGSKRACERIMYPPTRVSSATEDDVCGPGNRWMELDHQHVLRFYDVRFQNPTLYVVMDYAEGGSVRNALNSCTEDLDINLVKDWAIQIADGMNYLHTKEIIHRRLKSAQVLMMEPFAPSDSSKKTLKIASYSLATDGPSVPVSFKGMFAWMAPETIQDSHTCQASDVWSYGVTVWEMLTREIPYKNAKQAVIIRSITEGSPTLTIPDRCPDSIRDILKECWNRNMNKRPTFSDIFSRLRAVVDC